jgi:hypothetical protein
MSVYVGIDVHRKRSQLAVIDARGEVLVNRNVPNGVEPILQVIGGLPPGTPTASGAAFGTGWLVELLEGYGFEPHLVHPLRCKAIACARLKKARAGAEILAQLLRADLLPEARGRPARGAPAAGAAAAPGAAGAAADAAAQPDPRRAGRPRPRPPAGCWSGPGRDWLASLPLPAGSREVIGDGLALTGATEARTGRPRLGDPPACPVRPAGQGAHPAARGRAVHRAGHPGRDRRHHPVPGRPQAGVLGRADPGRPRQRPRRPLRAHPRAGLSVAAVGAMRGGPDRQAVPAVRRRLPGHRPTARQEDRHHRDRPQAAHPLLAPAHRRRTCGAAPRHRTGAGHPAQVTGRRGRQAPGELEEHPEPALPRSKN